MSSNGLPGSLLVVAGAVALILSSCSRKPAQIEERITLVPFEYLGSAPDLRWIGSALPSIVSAQTGSLIASQVSEAQLGRIPQVVQGYVTGAANALHATVVLRNEANQKTVRTLEARGSSVLELAAALSRQLTDQPKPYNTDSADAVREYFSGNIERAIAADPAFGAAHVARIEALVRSGRKDEIPKALESAKSARLTDLEQARLQTLTADTPKERTAGWMALARAKGYDLQLWRTAAEAAMTSKNHLEAVEAYKEALEIDPQNIAFWNTLGYVQTFAGDFESAKRSIAEYRRLAPKDANALDSLGEMYYYQGQFADAEKHFLQAFELDNALLGGGDLYRAALSRFLAGDLAGADKHFSRYLGILEKRNDTAAPLRQAIWLYVTGRQVDAKRRVAQIDSPQAKSQLIVWEMAEGKGKPSMLGDRPAIQGWRLLFERRYPEAVDYWMTIYQNASVINGNEARMLLVWALSGANRSAEAARLMENWPFPPAAPEPGLSSIAVAKFIQLKAAGR